MGVWLSPSQSLPNLVGFLQEVSLGKACLWSEWYAAYAEASLGSKEVGAWQWAVCSGRDAEGRGQERHPQRASGGALSLDEDRVLLVSGC